MTTETTTWGDLQPEQQIQDQTGKVWEVVRVKRTLNQNLQVVIRADRQVVMTKVRTDPVERVVPEPEPKTFIGKRHQESLEKGTRPPGTLSDPSTFGLELAEEKALEALAPLSPSLILPPLEDAFKLRGHLFLTHGVPVTGEKSAEDFKRIHRQAHDGIGTFHDPDGKIIPMRHPHTHEEEE